MGIRSFFKKIILGYKYSSETYISFLKSNGAKIGDNTFIYDPSTTLVDTSAPDFLEIGKYVQITSGCKILCHDYSYSVFFNVYHDLPRQQKITKIGNNVFLGMNTIVCMGSNIGDNVIIGAGSVVCGNVESNSVYAGVPAKKIYTLEQYYKKCRDNFVGSARVYAQIKSKNSTQFKEEDMIVYQSLFFDNEYMKSYINKATFEGINKTEIDKLKMDNYEHYRNINDLYN